MSAGWQVGDLALCLGEPRIGVVVKGWGVKSGQIYKVSSVERFHGDGGVGLNFEQDPKPIRGLAFDAIYFRKIKPDTEPCEEEFTVLIKRGRKVQA